MNASVSIVVPAYNVKPYIGECLDSLIAQGVSDMQIICVNDGSTDGTDDILDEYARNNRCISIITQENAGQSVARNVGLGHASGTYTMFCDADDMLATGALPKLIARAEQAAADIVYFDADSFFESESLAQSHGQYTTYYHRRCRYDKPRRGTQLIADMAANGDWRPSAPIQFYRTDFLRNNGLAFIPGIVHEDNAFSYCAALKAQSTSHIGEALYLRRVRSQSTMTTRESARNVIGYFKCFLAMMEASAEQGIEDPSVLEVPYGVLMLARNIFRDLAPEEQAASLEAFSGTNRIVFWAAIAKDAAMLDRIDSARDELESIKQSRRYALAEKMASIRNMLPG